MRLLAPLALAAVVGLSGCVPLVCPAIGYSSIVEVTVTAPDVVRLDCIEGCQGGIVPLDGYASTWRFDAPARPAAITVVGRDARGAEVLRAEVALVWTVEDPGNPCGSSASADPVTVG